MAPTEVVCVDEVREMAAELVVIVVVEAFHRCILDGAVHPFDLVAIQENDPPAAVENSHSGLLLRCHGLLTLV